MFLSPTMNASFYCGTADPPANANVTATLETTSSLPSSSTDDYNTNITKSAVEAAFTQNIEPFPLSAIMSKDLQVQPKQQPPQQQESTADFQPLPYAEEKAPTLQQQSAGCQPVLPNGQQSTTQPAAPTSFSSESFQQPHVDFFRPITPSSEMFVAATASTPFAFSAQSPKPRTIEQRVVTSSSQQEQSSVEEDPSFPPSYQLGGYDIICGRHKAAFNHFGNRRFRVTISIFLDRYLELRSRTERSYLILEIVDTVLAAGGHFLKFDKSQRKWVELDDKETRNKVGHALRDAAAAHKAAEKKKRKSQEKRRRSSSSVSLSDPLFQ